MPRSRAVRVRESRLRVWSSRSRREFRFVRLAERRALPAGNSRRDISLDSECGAQGRQRRQPAPLRQGVDQEDHEDRWKQARFPGSSPGRTGPAGTKAKIYRVCHGIRDFSGILLRQIVFDLDRGLPSHDPGGHRPEIALGVTAAKAVKVMAGAGDGTRSGEKTAVRRMYRSIRHGRGISSRRKRVPGAERAVQHDDHAGDTPAGRDHDQQTSGFFSASGGQRFTGEVRQRKDLPAGGRV